MKQILNPGVSRMEKDRSSRQVLQDVWWGLGVFQFICSVVLSSIFIKTGYRQAVYPNGALGPGTPNHLQNSYTKNQGGSSSLSWETQLDNHHLRWEMETLCLGAADSPSRHSMPAAALASPQTLYYGAGSADETLVLQVRGSPEPM